METSQNGEAIHQWLHRRLSDLLDLKPQEISDSEPLSSYGLSSIGAVGLAGELEDWLAVELADDLLWQYPTIEQVVGFLTKQSSGPHTAEVAT